MVVCSHPIRKDDQMTTKKSESDVKDETPAEPEVLEFENLKVATPEGGWPEPVDEDEEEDEDEDKGKAKK
jgi:hypothetical protein